MAIPSTLTLPAKDYDDLFAILKWEQSMPKVLSNYLGERYGEWMWEAKRDHIPIELEDWEYISHVELNGNYTGIIVVFCTDDKEGDINVPVTRGE